MSGLMQAGKSLRVQEFRTSGTFTVPAGCLTVSLFLVGGGGGATGGYAGGGGNVVEVNYDVSGKSTCAVVIGAGGTTGDGGKSSFDGVVEAIGGVGSVIQAAGQNPYPSGKNGFGGAAGQTGYGAPVNGGAGIQPLANSGAGSLSGMAGGSGYCRVEWYA